MMTAGVGESGVRNQTGPEGPPAGASFEKILVAVDYLASTSEVFQGAIALAKASGGRVKVCYCLPGRMPGMPDWPIYTAGMAAYAGAYSQETIELEEKLVQETTAELQAWLNALAQQAQEEGVEAEADSLTGDPGRQICAAAEEWGADLIVVGRRGRKGLSELLLGSVSNYVVHHAPCSVLTVQH